MSDPIAELQVLAGISNRAVMQEYKGFAGSNISVRRKPDTFYRITGCY